MSLCDEGRYRVAEGRLWALLGISPTERRVRLERLGLAVRIQEVGEGPAVIFVHGANTSGTSWSTLVARLDGFRRIVIDRPGTGLSERLDPPVNARTLPRFGDALIVDVLDALGLDSAHLVATSFGGYVALRTAAAHPQRVSRMVQFSWPVGAPGNRLPLFVRIAGIPGVARLMAALPPTDASVRMVFRQVGHGPSLDAARITPEDIACYVSLLRDTETLRSEMALGQAVVSPLRGLERVASTDELLAAIRTPTCFLWGERDPFGGADVGRELVRRMPNARLEVLSGAGHAPWLDRLDECVTATRHFLLSPSD